jgi:hypothetical protein
MLMCGEVPMLNRKIYGELVEWKNQKDKKCLIIKGARQVGKTYAIRTFGEKNYSEVVEINFKETPSMLEAFSGDLDVDTLVLALRFRFPEKKISPESTLIFFDEIQECPEAITSLKFWTDDSRFDVIASGSMLGIDYNRPSSYPVGYVEYKKMYGLDFEEFLWALGVSEEMISGLDNLFKERKAVPDAIHSQMMKYFRLYASLGGMPEVVQKYIETKDFREVDKIQKQLLEGYIYDIAHYATAEEKLKAEKCFSSLSRQLLDKENHKFQYKEIEKGARAQKYYSSIEWLTKADIIHLCKTVTDIKYDLDDYARHDFFRAYTNDLSLLIPMKDFSLKQHITENTLSGNTKGGLYECVIADILIKKGYKIYFYKNETTRKELDFIIQKDGEVIPIEVKSGNTKSYSLNQFVKKGTVSKAYKLIDGNVGENEDGIVSMPLYMAMFL